MNKRIITSAVAIVAAPAIAVGAASAQDWNLEPIYGQTDLAPGFEPDPHNVDVQAGGDLNAASTIGSDNDGNQCDGFVTSGPTYRLEYADGGGELALYVTSDADTTIVIRDPRGDWFCNDDRDGANPAFAFDMPIGGTYDIWIGTFDPGSQQAATLHISETSPFYFNPGYF